MDNQYFWTHVLADFRRAFTNTVAKEQAKSDLKNLKMDRSQGGLDAYIAKFEQLARASGYNINRETSLLERFIDGQIGRASCRERV